MVTALDYINYYKKKKFFRYGLPFLLLVVGGSFGLKQFTTIRFEYSRKKTVNKDEMEKMGVKMKESGEVTLDNEYEKIKKLDIDNWENIRGPRPWEEKF